MSEINLIAHYCCVSGKYCTFNDGFQEGYILGLVTIFLILSLLECTNEWINICRGPDTNVESDDEVENEEDNKKAEEHKKED
jgi:hypothetical protein